MKFFKGYDHRYRYFDKTRDKNKVCTDNNRISEYINI